MSICFLWLQLLLMFVKHVPALPVHDATARDWYTSLELMENANTTFAINNEYLESFTLKPIIIKTKKAPFPTAKNKFKEILFVAPQQTAFWIDVKSFFTNDVKNFTKVMADNYNPLPDIYSAIDNVKRSNTWLSLSAFFTHSFDRLMEISQSVINDLKNSKFKCKNSEMKCNK